MAFPDEDVLVGTRMNNPGAYELFASLDHNVPRPDHKASGEERAWGRRLAKRFDVPAASYDDRSFVITGNGEQPCVFDHETTKPKGLVTEVTPWFDELDLDRGDHRIAFAWARADDLEKLR